MVLYGRSKVLRELTFRRDDPSGEQAHSEAVSDQKSHERRQAREEENYHRNSGGRHLRVSARNNCTSCLSFGPSPALHSPAHIPICAGECAWVTNQNPAPYCA
ncbi:MAG TPA: hypothetical protein VK852_11895, partial [Desulfobacterales bacterium]|nr:hypothetical protein [Desulfobacterales bacterium]